jgi:hypothetical protein
MKDAFWAVYSRVCANVLVIGVVAALLCLWCIAGGLGGVLADGAASVPPATPTAAPGTTPPTQTPTTAAKAPGGIVGKWGAFAVATLLPIVVLALTVAVKGTKGINFFQSPDCSVSVSKVQIWMWTVTILFSYVYLALLQGPPDKIPDSLWELMGISALSTGAARYISAVTGDKPPAPAAQAVIAKQKWIVSMLSDDGQPSMMRLQMFGWTLVTIFLFLMQLYREQTLWAVPQALVILMGISHAGYLGDKGAVAAKSDAVPTQQPAQQQPAQLQQVAQPQPVQQPQQAQQTGPNGQ